ncbi:copper amine oxidase [Paenibacillus chitinolyticus]|uniref:Copper amine oxidase n=1 Tax=Paenibacillus chitinolyticus TaxID=79263 RepID=A0A410WRB5_9BACL|nr:copper amine oxidase N-terminal domain-containing protein [Paenibacillus chitinolyticus]MCY9591534.1 copper amine oxidase N-terminal domain-containing protein [Paenibacillus chitinolyticus]MCY9594633.1 copper amine oxidase N-terminal domain-containing protein [Paenibacillus chitinolyticus]QAV16872.1 copper amine oxidase [Paenibacillus chitinolyticus]
MLIRKLLKLSLLLLLLFGVSISFHYQGHVSAESAGTNRIITLTIDNPQADIDGQKTLMPAAPILMKDTSMVPFRFLGELLGAEVGWENSTQTVTLKGTGQTVTLSVGQREASVNGVSTILDQPAAIVNDTTLVPLRFIAESLNRNVAYDNASKVITIVPKEETKPVPPVPEKEAPKKKLEHPTVDNLSLKIGKSYSKICINYLECKSAKTRFVSSFVTDSNDNIYMIDYDAKRQIKYEYLISMYNQKTGDNRKLEQVLNVNEKFDIEYLDKKNQLQSLSYRDLAPEKIFYDEKRDKLYMMASVEKKDIKIVIYEILPEVKLITYNADETLFDEENDIMTTLDGVNLIFSNTFFGSIYSVEAGKERSLKAVIAAEKKPKLVSLIKDNKIYLMDYINKTIHMMREDGRLIEVAKVKMEKIGAAASKGEFFYAADKNGFYKIDVTGKVEDYVKLSELRYNSGLYEPKTKTYDQLVPGNMNFEDLPYSPLIQRGPGGEVVVGTLEMDFFDDTIPVDFAVDSQGNIIIHDNVHKLLRRINVYGYEQ